MLGQPELRELLARPEMRQFSQRINSDFHLSPLHSDEVEGYIQRRLEVAGGDRRLFSHAACELIYVATRGIPRLINVLCDLCLAYGFSVESSAIDETLLRELMSGMQNNSIFNQFTPLSSGPTPVEDDTDRSERLDVFRSQQRRKRDEA